MEVSQSDDILPIHSVKRQHLETIPQRSKTKRLMANQDVRCFKHGLKNILTNNGP